MRLPPDDTNDDLAIIRRLRGATAAYLKTLDEAREACRNLQHRLPVGGLLDALVAALMDSPHQEGSPVHVSNALEDLIDAIRELRP